MASIFYHRYSLKSRASLNARSKSRVHEGALLRIGDGFACLHPWPALGDVPLDQQLDQLRAGIETPQLASARRCAEADGAARREGRSLFSHDIPKSHWLVFRGDDPEKAASQGFRVAKFKIGRHTKAEARQIRTWAEVGFNLRLDANESFSTKHFLRFWNSLGDWVERVDLVEDPIPWSEESWLQLQMEGVPVAVDRLAESRHRERDIAVVKPALSNWIPHDGSEFLVTSYMDHAIGQCWAAVEAARLAAAHPNRMLGAGLMTHRCFEPDAFFEQIRTDGPRLVAPEGTGLGFDVLLESLPWKSLT